MASIGMTIEEWFESCRKQKERQKYARKHGVCLRCGRLFPPNRQTLCPRCRKEVDEILAKRREGMRREVRHDDNDGSGEEVTPCKARGCAK